MADVVCVPEGDVSRLARGLEDAAVRSGVAGLVAGGALGEVPGATWIVELPAALAGVEDRHAGRSGRLQRAAGLLVELEGAFRTADEAQASRFAAVRGGTVGDAVV